MKKVLKILIVISSLIFLSEVIFSCKKTTDSIFPQSQSTQESKADTYYRESGRMLIVTYNNIMSESLSYSYSSMNAFDRNKKLALALKNADKTSFSSGNSTREQLKETFRQVNYSDSTTQKVFSDLDEIGNTIVLLYRDDKVKKDLSYMYIEKK